MTGDKTAIQWIEFYKDRMEMLDHDGWEPWNRAWYMSSVYVTVEEFWERAMRCRVRIKQRFLLLMAEGYRF